MHMETLLLSLIAYPLIGVAIFPWMLHYEVKYTGMARDDWLMMLLPLFVIWPILVLLVPREWPQGKRVLIERTRLEAEREFLELEERVRREDRARTRREFAEFDKELGIEPEWKKAHPVAAREYEYIGKSQGGRPLRIPVVENIDGAQYRVKDIAPTSWGGGGGDGEQLARIEYTKRLGKMIFNRDLPNYSKGGRL